MKKIIRTLVSLSALSLLAACGGEPCTEDSLKRKKDELMEKLPELAAADPMKLSALAGKLTKISLPSSDNNLAAQCEAMDEIMEEIDDVLN